MKIPFKINNPLMPGDYILTVSPEKLAFTVKKVIFNDPATIVIWGDDSKTIIKCDNEDFDPEKGLAMAFAKKALGNTGRYYDTFKRWIPDINDGNMECDDYMNSHISTVQKAAYRILSLYPQLKRKVNMSRLKSNLSNHDDIKVTPKEYSAYDEYFYGNNKSVKKVENETNYAWLHHIHHNPHHWQHWILIHDNKPEEILEMPIEYVIEMIADWWSFSFSMGNPREIFSWYNEHKEEIKLHQKTRKLVENILDRIRVELDKEEADEKG